MNKLTTSRRKTEKEIKHNKMKKDKESKALDRRLEETFPASDSTAKY